MIVGVRRALAGLVLGVVMGCGAAGTALAETASPSPSPTSTATASAGVDAGESTADTPDVVPDNSRNVIAVGAAGALALTAAAVVFLRRH